MIIIPCAFFFLMKGSILLLNCFYNSTLRSKATLVSSACVLQQIRIQFHSYFYRVVKVQKRKCACHFLFIILELK